MSPPASGSPHSEIYLLATAWLLFGELFLDIVIAYFLKFISQAALKLFHELFVFGIFREVGKLLGIFLHVEELDSLGGIFRMLDIRPLFGT